MGSETKGLQNCIVTWIKEEYFVLGDPDFSNLQGSTGRQLSCKLNVLYVSIKHLSTSHFALKSRPT